MALLEVNNLVVHFRTPQGIAKAVDGVSFSVNEGETHVLVGESGCGKSVSALAIMGLLPPQNCDRRADALRFGNTDLLNLKGSQYRSVRGAEISMIFQEPMTSLNPVMRVGDQILEAVRMHAKNAMDGLPPTALKMRERVLELIEQMGLADPDRIYEKYPHELSGGMRQRIMIAMALAGRPRLLIADEPTTALDVTIQAQILELIKNIQKKLNTAVLLITHNLGVAAALGHSMSVMYAGQIVEQGRLRDVFAHPCHPYTKALFKALPSEKSAPRGKLQAIRGSVPPATAYDSLPSPCRFFERCDFQDNRCFEKDSAPGHESKCARENV